MNASSESTEREQVSTFALSLRQAVSDAREEAGSSRRVSLACDADVVLSVVLGMFGESPKRSGTTRGVALDRKVLRSALSVGMLGPMRMLDAHALELYENVEYYQERWPREESSFRNAVLQYVEREGIGRKLDELQESIQAEGEGQSARFLERLTDGGDRVFSALEHLRGHWRTRLRRLVDASTLDLSAFGDSVERILEQDGDRVETYLGALKQRRPKTLRINLRDAVALAALARMVHQARTTPDEVPILRFYTETLAMRDVMLDPVFAEDFQDPDGRTILRDRKALLFRAGHRALHPDARDNRAELDKLAEVADNASRLLEGEPDNFLRALELEGLDVRDLMVHFQADPIVRRLIESGGLPGKVIGEAGSWTEVYRYARSPELGELFQAEIGSVVEDLSDRLSGLSQWVALVDRIESIVDENRGHRVKAVQNPRRDLGLIRWGGSLTASDLTRVEGLVRVLLDPDTRPDMLRHAVLELVQDIQSGRHDVRACEQACYVLWALLAWQEIVDLGAACESETGAPLPASLYFISAAARLRDRAAGAAEIADIVEASHRHWNRMGPDERSRLALAYGHVLFRAWERSSESPRVANDTTAEAWATESLESVRQVYERDSVGDGLHKLFMLNHMTYVAVRAGLRDQEYFPRVFSEMMKFRTTKSWNYRVSDTVACVHIDNARRMLEPRRGGGPQGPNMKSLNVELRNARTMLNEARQGLEDIAVHEHEVELAAIEDRIRDLKARSS